ncbi:MAG: hypothetical protein P4L41_13210 [Flavipsychrobacter sp.]|nr:hypothetical protein [Flavipsychrobacter sp.]
MKADMENIEDLELHLWDYIDGRCNAAEQERIAQLLMTNELWRSKYAEFMAFNTSMHDNMAIDQPSMRFAKNIMDSVTSTTIAPAAKNYINFKIIKGIAAFFFIAIAGLCIVAFSGSSMHSTYTGYTNNKSSMNLNLSLLASPAIMNLMIIIGILLGLLLTDNLLRSRDKHVVR